MLFLASEKEKVQRVSRVFSGAGIGCEVRKQRFILGPPRPCPLSELWIQNDTDCHRALKLCVELGMGFSRGESRCESNDYAEQDQDISDVNVGWQP